MAPWHHFPPPANPAEKRRGPPWKDETLVRNRRVATVPAVKDVIAREAKLPSRPESLRKRRLDRTRARVERGEELRLAPPRALDHDPAFVALSIAVGYRDLGAA